MTDLSAIAPKYERFPKGYINDVRGWAFDSETIHNQAGKLLTLDLDFGSRCSLNCPFCFRRDNSVDKHQRAMRTEDVLTLVDEAMELGLRTVKFLGAGEPLENPGFLHLLRELSDRGIISVVFTKTGILGNDRQVNQLYGGQGIGSSQKLCEVLESLGVSIVLGFNSLDPEIQSLMVGNGRQYVERRDRSLLNLLDTGFADSNPTRLALGINPITNLNIRGAAGLYKWARVRNIYAIVTPTMISGRAKGDAWRLMTPKVNELEQLYVDIYNFNFQTGLQSKNQVLKEGISAYAGGHPCNQVSTGLYVTLNGVVLRCPGSEDTVQGNIWTRSIEDVWLTSKNYQMRGTFNCACVAKDGKSIPRGFYDEVLSDLASERSLIMNSRESI